MQLAFHINIMLGNKTMWIHAYTRGCTGLPLRFSFRTLRIETIIPLANKYVGSRLLSAETLSRDCPLQGLPSAKGICLAPGYTSPGATN